MHVYASGYFCASFYGINMHQYIYVLLFSTVHVLAAESYFAKVDGAPPTKIAVIGAGIGGTATAHFLRQHFGPEVRIDVFEKNSVGGRLATVTVNHQDYESGGSIIHSLNLHMQDFVQQLGLKYRKSVAGKTAVFNGEEFILSESDWYLLDLFRLWWRYGISFIRLQMWVEEIMEKFMRIYKYQAHGYAFSSVEELLHSLGGSGFINMTRRSLSESLLELGVSQRFIDEVIAPIMRVNYGQNISIPAFVGAVSLAGAQTNLWAVEGGNKLVCSGLLKLAKANLIQSQVTTIQLQSKGDYHQYELTYNSQNEKTMEVYDIVVVATPLQQNVESGISFQGFETDLPEMPGSYHKTVASIVHGYLNCSFFGFPDPKLFPFSSVLTRDTHGVFFNSAASICPVNITSGFRRKQPQEAGVYKVFSPKPLEKNELKTLFKSYYSVQVTEWLAYPQYGSTQGLPPVVLHDGLYYLNGIEWAASAMEMSSVAAKNIALLAYHRWNRQVEMIDQKDLMHKVKTEL
ncbi:prenylcysteine oxidase 1-like [Paramisgurnus dabryanus]|uniref:prenylcysteine oxidase 1-like n=1 Tax=Paramisgurnus dabryanus TaxID=90735 RepID=UPI0031F46687